jgi:hypothetical protein
MTGAGRTKLEEGRSHTRLLALLTVGLVSLGALPLLAPAATIDWRGQWIVAVLIAAGVAFGAFQLFGEEEPRGVPLESLVTPTLVAVAVFAVVPAAVWVGVHPAFALVGAVAAGAVAVRAALDAEAPFVRLGKVTAASDRRTVEAFLLGAAFLVFIGVAATLPGGWPLPEIDRPFAPLTESAVALGVADAVVGLLVGYRLTVLSGAGSAVGWASATYAVVVGIAAVAFRWLAIPGLMGPAVLAVVLYLRAVVSTAPTAERPSRWPLEAIALVVVVVAIVGYQLLAR